MLIELTIKSSLVLIVALASVAAMRRWSAARRHVILASALIATLALPAIAAVGPHWWVPSSSAFSKASELAHSRPIGVRPSLTDGSTWGLQPLQKRGGTSNVPSRWSVDDWVRLLTIVWLVGAGISVVRLFHGITSAARLAHDAHPMTSSEWNDSLSSIANSIGLAPRVALRTSAHASVPLAWRFGRTCTLILPNAAERWQTDTRRAVLLHECGHLERHDCVVRSLAILACGFWWFNPLAHLALRRLRSEQERACDDLVLVAGMERVDYARQLFEIARSSITDKYNAAAVVAMVRRSELEDRMLAIIDRSRDRRSLSRGTGLVATAIVVALVATLGGLRMSATRTQSVAPGSMRQLAGPGGPQFEWMRQVDEETRQRVVGALDAASHDSDPQVRAVAEQAVQTIREMPHGTVTVSGACRGACVVGPVGLPSIAEAIFETETKMALWELRRHGVTRLSAHSERGADALAELLRDQDPEVRTLAAIRLDSMIFPPAVPGWIDLLVDKDDSLRERAAISLGAIGDPVAIDGLTSVLLNDPNPDVRRQAARSLGLIAAGN